ncbi:hypothetical protein D9M73_115140 [compost metagenome]|jgi:hypothetical protein
MAVLDTTVARAVGRFHRVHSTWMGQHDRNPCRGTIDFPKISPKEKQILLDWEGTMRLPVPIKSR